MRAALLTLAICCAVLLVTEGQGFALLLVKIVAVAAVLRIFLAPLFR